MKKNLLTILSLALLLSSSLFAQSEASAKWELIVDSTAVAAGEVVAEGMTKTADLFFKDWKGGNMYPGAPRIHMGSVAWPKDSLPNFDRFVEFKVQAKAGYTFTVKTIKYIMACTGTTGHFHANAYMDTDPTFANKQIVDTTSAGIVRIDDTIPEVQTKEVNVKVPDGAAFYLRMYPWYDLGGSTSKYFVPAAIEIIGTTEVATDINTEIIPTDFTLEQNYPNPFNPSTKIVYSVPQSGNVQIKVFDQLGREVATLLNEEVSSGYHNINWDATGNGLSSGVYFIQMRSANFVKAVKAILMK